MCNATEFFLIFEKNKPNSTFRRRFRICAQNFDIFKNGRDSKIRKIAKNLRRLYFGDE